MAGDDALDPGRVQFTRQLNLLCRSEKEAVCTLDASVDRRQAPSGQGENNVPRQVRHPRLGIDV